MGVFKSLRKKELVRIFQQDTKEYPKDPAVLKRLRLINSRSPY